MRIYTSIQELVGKTPIVELKKIEDKLQLKGRIYAKLESFNPAGSVKDRIAKAMIEDAKRRGVIQEGSVLVEPTSGNTGIGLAAAAAAMGLRLILVMQRR